MRLEVVEVLQDFEVRDYRVRAGARVLAWRTTQGALVVYFNGGDVHIREGVVGPIGSGLTNEETQSVYSSARLEEYQVAPAKPK